MLHSNITSHNQEIYRSLRKSHRDIEAHIYNSHTYIYIHTLCERDREMEFLKLFGVFIAFMAVLCLFLLFILTLYWWVFPNQTHKKLKLCGFGGPTPSFPLGNIKEMKRKNSSITQSSVSSSSNMIQHDIHSHVFPYFSCWQKSHGKSSYKPI